MAPSRSALPCGCSRAPASPPRRRAFAVPPSTSCRPRSPCAEACRWSGGAQTLRSRPATRAARPSRRSCSTARRRRTTAARHDLRRGRARAARRRARRRRQRDRRRALARRGREPAVDRRACAPTSLRARCGSTSPTRSRASPRVEVRLAGAVLETRLAADGRTAVARVPAGLALDGASVSVRALDASSPANAASSASTLPVRPLPALRGLSVSQRRRDRPGRGRRSRPRADLGLSQGPRAAARRQLRHARRRHVRGARVRPRRTTRYAVGVLESQGLLGLAEQSAGTLRVTARITGAEAARPRRPPFGQRALRRARRGHAPAPARARPARRALGRGLPRARAARRAPRAHGPRLGHVAVSRRAPAAAPGRIASSWPRPRAPGRGARRRAPRAACSCLAEAECWDLRADPVRLPV